MATINLLYGTTSGNTELVVDQLSLLLQKAGHAICRQRVELARPTAMGTGDCTILASSTYGHGLLQEDMAVFLDQARKENFSFNKKPCAVVGLGDPKYDPEHHIEAARILEQFIQDQKGELLVPALRVSRSPVLHLESLGTEWTKQLLKKLNQ